MPEPTRTVLGCDFGTHRLGLAVGNTLTGTGSPLATLPVRNRQPDWARFAALLDEWRPDAVIVGLPLNMDSTASPMSEAARTFARQVRERFGVRVIGVDERLSTREARERAGSHRGTTPADVDALAAQIILEAWLADPGVGVDP